MSAPWHELCFFVPGLKTADCAAWFQFLGSILAILAGAGFVLLQHKLERRRDVIAETRRMHARVAVVAEIARASTQHAKYLCGLISSRERLIDYGSGERQFDHAGLQNIDAPLASLPLGDLEDPEVVNGVMILLADLRQFRGLLQQLLVEYRFTDAVDFDAAEKGLKDCVDSCERMVTNLRGKLERLMPTH